jgi:hypothetical protein
MIHGPRILSLTLALAVCSLLCLGARSEAQSGKKVAGSKGAAKAKRHEHLHHAMGHMKAMKNHKGKKGHKEQVHKTMDAVKSAREHLSKASHDFGGHRTKALASLSALHDQLAANPLKASKHLDEAHMHLENCLRADNKRVYGPMVETIDVLQGLKPNLTNPKQVTAAVTSLGKTRQFISASGNDFGGYGATALQAITSLQQQLSANPADASKLIDQTLSTLGSAIDF